ncbi:transporter substrate-binding domain-containing protein [Sinorhizobium americanum]|nr:transporter substrate-binding domain-containing protein [Sinorhizobium americanum]
MKTLTTTASIVFASFASAISAHAGEVLDRVLSTKTLTVAVGTDWGAVSHLNDKGLLVGCDVDIANAIAKYLGVEVKFVTPGWDIIMAGNWQGRWDMAMGQMAPKKERERVFDFPANYYYEQVVAVVHRDSKTTKLADLDGKTVGALANSAYNDYANHKLNPDWKGSTPITYQFKPGAVTSYGATTMAFDDLRLGDGVRLDAVIADKVVANTAISKGYPMKILNDPLYAAPAAIAILKGDNEFSEKIAAAVKGMKDDGSLSKLSIKWYGADYSTEK